MRKATKLFFDAFADSIYDIVRLGYQQNILHNPRLVMYKLLGRTINGIKVDKSFGDKIGATIAVMKYQGLIPNNWTIDTTRAVSEYNSFTGVSDAVETLANQWYYLNRWDDQPKKFILMCEASGYLGVIKHIADEFRIPYVPAKGDMSIQLKIDIANSLTDDTIILYFGDYDKHGIRIPQTIVEDMHIINPGGWKMIRMFVNEEDIERYKLEVDDKGQVQMEQFPTDIAIKETREYIYSFIDKSKWDAKLEDEKLGREKILSIV